MLDRLSLRQRNRLTTMRLVQETAVDLIEAQGFDSTSVEEIAETSGVSASTVYRHFGTKEGLVLWDEQDSAIDAELGRRLRDGPALESFRDAVISGLADRPDPDLFLRRLKLIYSVSSIWAVAAHRDRIDRSDLASAIASFDGRSKASTTDSVTAAVCLAALDVALDAWQSGDGRERLDELISLVIEAAGSLT